MPPPTIRLVGESAKRSLDRDPPLFTGPPFRWLCMGWSWPGRFEPARSNHKGPTPALGHPEVSSQEDPIPNVVTEDADGFMERFVLLAFQEFWNVFHDEDRGLRFLERAHVLLPQP